MYLSTWSTVLDPNPAVYIAMCSNAIKYNYNIFLSKYKAKCSMTCISRKHINDAIKLHYNYQ